ncbi:hypothetical protein [Thalassoglobus polymorphus]|uniref:Uncharacterized protein n=1 Tax=Thalassoglobus polymorphus TaxID=2527994 RepID=A0A517QUM1_9PLAN|nr:hypothetical protein [Thalassoglobus polymorphus]QDT35314.1 hypothetical protein Mal48_45900 [Thalassoglobus polymorphus]
MRKSIVEQRLQKKSDYSDCANSTTGTGCAYCHDYTSSNDKHGRQGRNQYNATERALFPDLLIPGRPLSSVPCDELIQSVGNAT